MDLGAAKTRFLNTHVGDLVALCYANPPALKFMDSLQSTPASTEVTQYHTPTKTMFTLVSLSIRDLYLKGDSTRPRLLPQKFQRIIEHMNRIFLQCQTADTTLWISQLLEFSNATIPFLNTSELDQLWKYFLSGPCYARLLPQQQDWMTLLHAVSLRQYRKMADMSQWLLRHNMGTENKHFHFLVATAMLGEIMSNNPSKAQQIKKSYQQKHKLNFETDLLLRLLDTHSLESHSLETN